LSNLYFLIEIKCQSYQKLKTMKKTLQCAIFCFLMCAINTLNAQDNHFRASVSAGINLSQMEGDGQEGYHKIGPSIGVKGAYILKPHIDIGAELLYNSRGSRPNPFAKDLIAGDRTTQLNAELNYADILLAANFHFMPNSGFTYYRQSLQIGVSYGRLISSKIAVNTGIYPDVKVENDLLDNLKKDDIDFVLGYSWFFTSRLGVTAKHTFSLRNIYSNPLTATSNRDYANLNPYNLSLQLTFNLITPKINVKAQVEKQKKAKERKKRNALEEL
jgi:hypothetical protein